MLVLNRWSGGLGACAMVPDATGVASNSSKSSSISTPKDCARPCLSEKHEGRQLDSPGGRTGQGEHYRGERRGGARLSDCCTRVLVSVRWCVVAQPRQRLDHVGGEEVWPHRQPLPELHEPGSTARCWLRTETDPNPSLQASRWLLWNHVW
jgi:hypothetical protein